jgi:hypothetical protein
VANRLDTLSLQTTASQLAAQFRKAQAEAEITQRPVAATYSNHEFRFLSGPKELAAFSLPVSIFPAFDNGLDTFLLLPSGQISGPERVKLFNQHGKAITVELGLLASLPAGGQGAR